MAPHSSTLAWKIPWTEEPGGLHAVHGVAKSRARLNGFTFTLLSCIGEGNGNPLQCSCLEYPRDRGAWWAAVYGVAQSWTRLKRLSSSISSSINKTNAITLKDLSNTESQSLNFYFYIKIVEKSDFSHLSF